MDKFSLKVISYNIWDAPYWASKEREERIPKIAEYLKKTDADIICLQESFSIQHRRIIYETIGPDKYFSTCEFEKYRRLPFATLDKTGGLVIFSKFPIVSCKFLSFLRLLKFSPEIFSLSEFFAHKGVQDIVVQTPKGPLQIINTHLYPKNRRMFFKKYRLRQLSVIFEKIINQKRAPVILAGDLNEDNLTGKEDFFAALLQSGFDFSGVGSGLLLPSYRMENALIKKYRKQKKTLRLDYIFTKSINQFNLEAQKNSPVYLRPELSDHDPIVLSLIPSVK